MRYLLIVFTLTTGFFWSAGLSNAQDKADPKLIAAVEKAGGQAMEIAQNDPRLTVAFHLSDKKIGDDDLAILKGSETIVELNLRGTDVTDAGLAHVATLKNLKKLHLEKSKVTDAGLEQLKGLTNLEYLNLYGTEVSDAGIEHLKGMKSLKKVYLWETKVTEAGQEALKVALEGAYVNRGIDKPDYPLIADKPLEPVAAPEEEKKEEKKE